MNPIVKFVQNKTHVTVQFIKYGLAGVVATGVHVVVFTILNETVLPAGLSEENAERGWNFFWSFSIAFIVASGVAYDLNRRWVFQSGRHTRLVELALFFSFATIAYLLGTPLGAFLVSKYPLNEYVVYFLVLTASVLVNFLGRKLVVFQH
jgi:putative flippase GtrA